MTMAVAHPIGGHNGREPPPSQYPGTGGLDGSPQGYGLSRAPITSPGLMRPSQQLWQEKFGRCGAGCLPPVS